MFSDFSSGSGLRYYIIADHIEDPGNLGAIIRSMAAFNASGLIVPRKKQAPLGAVAMKASAGHLLSVPVMHTAGIPGFINQVRKKAAAGRGNLFWALESHGLALNQAQESLNISDDVNVFILLGSEGQGVSRLSAELCENSVSISMNPGVESLNVSVAAAIVLHSLYTLIQSET